MLVIPHHRHPKGGNGSPGGRLQRRDGEWAYLLSLSCGLGTYLPAGWAAAQPPRYQALSISGILSPPSGTAQVTPPGIGGRRSKT